MHLISPSLRRPRQEPNETNEIAKYLLLHAAEAHTQAGRQVCMPTASFHPPIFLSSIRSEVRPQINSPQPKLQFPSSPLLLLLAILRFSLKPSLAGPANSY
eukprot:GHVU01034623.1.p2 GENE.GHVU01034623.1~~GHVU01034623.1.p2  ORF type:complete len:101 (-),score=10.36 GHVU01034623.1:713-1015(-)